MGFSLYLCLFLFCYINSFYFLYSTYKWSHTVFVFLSLILLNTIPSRSIHVVENAKISLFFMSKYFCIVCVCVYYIFFICSPVNGHFHSLGIGNPAAMNIQFSSIAQSCPTLRDPMDCSTLGFPGLHQLPKFTQTHVHQVGDAIQPFHPLSSLSLPTLNLSQHQGLLQWRSSSHQVSKVLKLQRQSFSWILSTDSSRIDWSSTVCPSICHEVMGPDAMILVFWMLIFKPTFSLSSFTFFKRLFTSSLLSAIRVVSSACLRLLIFLPAILIPAQRFSWCTLHIS